MRKLPSNPFEIDLLTVRDFVLDNVRLIGGFGLAGALVACTIAVRSPDIYQARSTIQVEHDGRKVVRLEERSTDEHDALQMLNTIEHKLTSPDLLLRVGRSPGLLDDPKFLPDEERPIPDMQLQRQLGKRVSAEVRTETNLIDLRVEDENPLMAQRIAELLVKEFLQQEGESSEATAQDANEFLWKESERLAEKLAASERKLQKFREQTRAVSLEEKQNIVVERLRELNTKVTAAKEERLRHESDRAQVAELGNAPSAALLAIPVIANSSAVSDLQRQIDAKGAELATLARRYKPEYPKYAAAADELRQLRLSLAEAIQSAASRMDSAHRAAMATEAKLEEALKAQEEIALELDRTAIPYQVLAREVESDRTLYESVLARLKESDVSRSASNTEIQVVSRPFLPDRPVKPSRPRIALLGLFGGLALGASIAMARRAMDGSMRTLADAEHRLGMKALGVVPAHRPAQRGAAAGMIPLVSAPASGVSEAFRGLRTSLSFIDGGKSNRSVLFTSAVPSEGKTFCSVNCALAIAQAGTNTLLIDADLRKPAVSKVLFGKTWQPGVAEALSGEVPWQESVVPTEIATLHVLPAGAGHCANPAEVVAKGDFARILRDALRLYDHVVIDSAPVNAVSDTLVIARLADVVGLVVKAGFTPATTVERAKRKLVESGCEPAGFIFNAATIRNSDGYYYPGYGNAYSQSYAENRPSQRLHSIATAALRGNGTGR